MNSELSILILMRIEKENIDTISREIDKEMSFLLKKCFL